MIEKILAAIAALTLIFVLGTIVVLEVNKTDMIVVVDLKAGEDPFALQALLPDDTVLVSVRSLDPKGNKYEIILKTRKPKERLFDIFKNTPKIQDFQIRGS